jgi:hypothetical protein
LDAILELVPRRSLQPPVNLALPDSLRSEFEGPVEKDYGLEGFETQQALQSIKKYEGDFGVVVMMTAFKASELEVSDHLEDLRRVLGDVGYWSVVFDSKQNITQSQINNVPFRVDPYRNVLASPLLVYAASSTGILVVE